MKILVLAVLCAAALFSQGGPPVNQVDGPPPAPIVQLFDYSGSSLIYKGFAPAFLQSSSVCANLGATCIQRTDSTLTSIAVATNVATVTCASACGVWQGQRVTVSGATVDTDLNGTYTVTSDTSTSATTYTFTTANVADATYNEATLRISTNSPLTTQAMWAIQIFKTDTSSNTSTISWANNSVSYGLAWSNRTTY